MGAVMFVYSLPAEPPPYRGTLRPPDGDPSLSAESPGQPSPAAEREASVAYDNFGDFMRPVKFPTPENEE